MSTRSSRTRAGQAGGADGCRRPGNLRRRSDEHADLVWLDAIVREGPQPVTDGLALVGVRGKRANLRRRPVEHGDGMATILAVAVDVGHLRAEQSVGLLADLV